MKDLNAVLPASGKNGDDTGWVRFKLPIASDPGQIQGAVDKFLETPWYGSRQMARHLRRNGWCVGRHRIRRLMTKMGLAPIYQRPKTSEPHPRHRIWPYLLRHLTIDRRNQVWCADVTYIPMRRGFLYLVAIMDWFSRKVLAWQLSNTMDADFCVTALEQAIAGFG